MKLKLKDKNGTIYKIGDKVLNPISEEIHVIKWSDYKYIAEGFYNSHQDNPEDFFSEGYYNLCEIIK